MRILIADDDKEIIDSTRGVLSLGAGYQVDVARDGKEALEKIKKDVKYDIVVLDVLLDKVNGIEICGFMARDNQMKKVPVILISILPLYSGAFQKSLERFNELSIVRAVLEKPFSASELMVKVRTSIRK